MNNLEDGPAGPKRPYGLSQHEFEELLERLQAVLSGCGPNRVDQAIAGIEILITEGLDRIGQIIGILMRLKFSNRQIAAVLKNHEGSAPHRHRWQLGRDGRYRLHADQSQ